MTLLEAKITAGIIIYKDGKILGVKGVRDDAFDIPKGNKEKKEKSKSAAVRETEEETGLHIKKSELKKLGTYAFGDNLNKTLKLYLYDVGKSGRIINPSLLGSKRTIQYKGHEYPEKDVFAWKELTQTNNFQKKLREILQKVNNKLI